MKYFNKGNQTMFTKESVNNINRNLVDHIQKVSQNAQRKKSRVKC